MHFSIWFPGNKLSAAGSWNANKKDAESSSFNSNNNSNDNSNKSNYEIDKNQKEKGKSKSPRGDNISWDDDETMVPISSKHKDDKAGSKGGMGGSGGDHSSRGREEVRDSKTENRSASGSGKTDVREKSRERQNKEREIRERESKDKEMRDRDARDRENREKELRQSRERDVSDAANRERERIKDKERDKEREKEREKEGPNASLLSELSSVKADNRDLEDRLHRHKQVTIAIIILTWRIFTNPD